MTDYNIKFTDSSKPPIRLGPKSINTDYDITLFGRTRLRYGREMNENLLHLLEHFACPEDPNNIGNPDLSVSILNLLSNPVEGQIWLNSTQNRPFFWDGSQWLPMSLTGDYAANSGIIAHGEYLPRPVSDLGYVFPYSECAWIVSPANVPVYASHIVCYVDSDGKLTMLYRENLSPISTPGCANYFIVGVKQ
jgi:hypothetical protein